MEEQSVKTAHGEMAVFFRNGINPVLFFHGMGCSKDHFSGAFLNNTGKDREVVAVDFPGAGKSLRLPDKQAYSEEVQTQMIKDVIETLGISKPLLVCHSISSFVLPVLLNDLETSGVILIEGNLFREDTELSTKVSQMSDAEYDRYYHLLGRMNTMMMKDWLKKKFDKDTLKQLSQCLIEIDARAYRETAIMGREMTIKGKIFDTVVNYNLPKMYIRGSLSDPWGRQDQLVQAGVIYHEIGQAGHFPHIDNPKDTYDAIFSFTK